MQSVRKELESRINIDEPIINSIVAMAEGNPGAASVMAQLIEKNEAIDPQSMLKSFGGVMMLDTCKIYGSSIWIVYKDICQQNIAWTIGLLRAAQLGIIHIEDLKEASVEKYPNEACVKLIADLPDILKSVQAVLPELKLGGTDNG